MTKQKRQSRGSLSRLLIKSYLIFAAITISMVLLAVHFFLNYTPSYSSSNYMDMLQLNELKTGQYDKISSSKYLGRNGWFEVLDENGSVIYASRPSTHTNWSEDELQYVEDAGSGTTYYLDELEEENESRYMLQRYTGLADRQLDGIAILDQDYQILYTDMNFQDGKISQQAVNTLLNNGGDPSTYLLKYAFTSSDGSEKTLLLHADLDAMNNSSDLWKRTAGIVLIGAAVILLVMFLLVLHASRQIQKPLHLLNQSIDNVEHGKKADVPSYKGPQEFVEILNSFDRMADQLEESEVKRKQAEEERQRMLADISHDLKTPVTVIQGYAGALADHVVPENEEQKYLNLIQHKSEEMTGLINQFYELSKLEHPSFSLHCIDIDLAEYFRQYLADKYDELEIAGFQLEASIPEKQIMASIDPSEFKRVLDNLLSNCMHANTAGTRIHASIAEENDHIIIHAGDNGRGIDPSIRDHIFEPFVTGNEARTSGKGTGLGLAIAKRIVEAHGGTIRLMNQDETGKDIPTMFEIVLPSLKKS